MFGDEDRHHHGGRHDAKPDTTEMQRLQIVSVGCGKVTEDDIKTYCKQQLAEYKVPHIVEFRGELPKTDVGKVSRRELREESSA